jgi:hypothetical protein
MYALKTLTGNEVELSLFPFPAVDWVKGRAKPVARGDILKGGWLGGKASLHGVEKTSSLTLRIKP